MYFMFAGQSCPGGYSMNDYGCHVAHNETDLTFDDANTECMMMEGGVLASIKKVHQWTRITSDL